MWLPWGGVLSRFRVPSWLPLLSCHVGSSWSGQSVPIVQQVCTDHELTLPHQSFIPPPIYVPVFLLLVVSRLFCPCMCLNCHCSLPVPLSPCAAELKARRSSSSCGPQTLPAGSGISAPKQPWNIVYDILCFVTRIKFLLHPHSASESFSTHTLTQMTHKTGFPVTAQVIYCMCELRSWLN